MMSSRPELHEQALTRAQLSVLVFEELAIEDGLVRRLLEIEEGLVPVPF